MSRKRNRKREKQRYEHPDNPESVSGTAQEERDFIGSMERKTYRSENRKKDQEKNHSIIAIQGIKYTVT
jgi:hypothetical protein